MNRQDLQDVQGQKSFPCVSISLPTFHANAVNLQENQIRYKTLVKQAQDRLEAETDKHVVASIVERLHALESDLPFDSPGDGLIAFANADYARGFALPFAVPESVMVDDTFHTRYLVHAINRTKNYLVMTLTRDVVRLYRATRDKLTPVEGHGFPMTPDAEGTMTEMDSTRGVDIGQYANQQERVLLQHADNALTKVLAGHNEIGLVIVGDPRAIGYFTTDSSHKENILGTASGNYEKLGLQDLAEKVWPAAREGFAARRDSVLQNFEDAANNLRAEGLTECWFVAHEGRVGTLLIEEDYHAPGQVSEDGMNLELIDDAATPGALDDAVDELVEAVLKMNGRVTFFESGALGKHQRVAAILRF